MEMNYRDHRAPDDWIVGWLQPDTLLPAQFFEQNRRTTLLQPEMLLMLAVLEDGLDHFQKYFLTASGKGRRLFHEAKDWIFDTDGDELFSFEHICEILGFDPNYIRRGLLLWSNAVLTGRLKPHFRQPDSCRQRERSFASRRKRNVSRLRRLRAVR